MSTNFNPLERENAAFKLKSEKKFAEAATLFMEIVQQFPNWEDGGGAFNLAFCLEEIGDFDGALKAYKVALSCEPSNETFFGNYNSLKRHIAAQR